MDKVSKVLTTLMSGKWFKISELKEEVSLGYGDLKRILEFLVEYDFIVLREDKGVKASDSFLKLVREFTQRR